MPFTSFTITTERAAISRASPRNRELPTMPGTLSRETVRRVKRPRSRLAWSTRLRELSSRSDVISPSGDGRLHRGDRRGGIGRLEQQIGAGEKGADARRPPRRRW